MYLSDQNRLLYQIEREYKETGKINNEKIRFLASKFSIPLIAEKFLYERITGEKFRQSKSNESVYREIACLLAINATGSILVDSFNNNLDILLDLLSKIPLHSSVLTNLKPFFPIHLADVKLPFDILNTLNEKIKFTSIENPEIKRQLKLFENKLKEILVVKNEVAKLTPIANNKEFKIVSSKPIKLYNSLFDSISSKRIAKLQEEQQRDLERKEKEDLQKARYQVVKDNREKRYDDVIKKLTEIEEIRKTRKLTEEEIIKIINLYGPHFYYAKFKEFIIVLLSKEKNSLNLDQQIDLSNMFNYTPIVHTIPIKTPSVHEEVGEFETDFVKVRKTNSLRHSLIVFNRILDIIDTDFKQEFKPIDINTEFPTSKHINCLVKKYLEFARSGSDKGNQIALKFKKLYNNLKDENLLVEQINSVFYSLAEELMQERMSSVLFYIKCISEDTYKRALYSEPPLNYDDIKTVVADGNYANLHERLKSLKEKYLDVQTEETVEPTTEENDNETDESKKQYLLIRKELDTLVEILKNERKNRAAVYRFTSLDALLYLKHNLDTLLYVCQGIKSKTVKPGFTVSDYHVCLNFLKTVKTTQTSTQNITTLSYLINGKEITPTKEDYKIVKDYLKANKLPVNDYTISIAMARHIKGGSVEGKDYSSYFNPNTNNTDV